MKAKIKISLFLILSVILADSCKKEKDALPENTGPELIVSNLQFAEGPAYYSGNLYFSDILANKIYKWNSTDGLSIFKENSGGANGLFFDKSGSLVVCEGSNKRVTLIKEGSPEIILAEKYEDKPFNEPNDLWISRNGNIYFTDPVFSGTLTQTGEYVYCILSSNGQVIKVADDLVKPNGIIGNADGTVLYIADYGGSKIYQYLISSDGTIYNKQLFAEVQADGLSIDDEGNIYAASKSMMKYNSSGAFVESIEMPGTLTNLCFVKTEEEKALYVTTHDGVYQIKL